MREISRLRTRSIPTVIERKSLVSATAPVIALVVVLASSSAPARESLALRREAEVRALNAELLSHPSATETLTRWCADHRLAAEPRIVAVRQPNAVKPANEATLALLGGVAADQVRYRRVELRCGSRALSEADNWYRPDRLTPEMNAALETSQTPFGIVVRPLAFTRRTITVTIARSSGAGSSGQDVIAPFVLRHRAVLSTGGGTPFSVVEESYTPEILADTTN